MRYGSSIEPTYTETFDTQDAFNLYKVINANNDNYTWKWHEVLQCAQYEANLGRAADDWLVSPPIHLQANHVYTLSFKARNSLVYYNEMIEAKWGNQDNVSALTNEVIGQTTLSGAVFQPYGKEITSAKDQTIYLGIHALSPRARPRYSSMISPLPTRVMCRVPTPCTVFALSLTLRHAFSPRFPSLSRRRPSRADRSVPSPR